MQNDNQHNETNPVPPSQQVQNKLEKKNHPFNMFFEVVSLSILFILIVLIANPFNFFMPSMMVVALLIVFFMAVVLSSAFVWNETAQDEREVMNRATAGRIGYLVGSSILTVGIIVQELQHALDLWLVYALGAIIAAKVLTIMYLKAKEL